MSILNRENPPATEDDPLYVKFEKVLRTSKDNGVTLFDAVGKFQDGREFKFEKDQITLYDNHFGKSGDECPLTNPCMVYKNDRGYWDVRDIAGQPEVHASPLEAPKPAPREGGYGGGGGGGGSRSMTRAQLDAAIAYAIDATTETLQSMQTVGATSDATVGVFAKILGCAMFVEWPDGEVAQEGAKPAAADGPPPLDDGDIPFHSDAPRAGLI